MTELFTTVNRNSETFDGLKPTLLSWLHILGEYPERIALFKDEKRECHYWHQERSEVGFFAIAAWLNGWAVLQEWVTQKKESVGRNDLWIGRGRSQLFIEAKKSWSFVDKGKGQIDADLIKEVNHTKDAASCLMKEPKVAALFISPVWHEGGMDFDEARSYWKDEVSKAGDAVACILHDRAESPVDSDGGVCIGATLILVRV